LIFFVQFEKIIGKANEKIICFSTSILGNRSQSSPNHQSRFAQQTLDGTMDNWPRRQGLEYVEHGRRGYKELLKGN
jgi:hypothetical protein